jgi:Protein kinase domain/Gram-negative bacterial TonB protein C-terminal
MTEDWTKWQNLVINGVFPLRRFLGRSDHSVVFLTEHRSQQLPNAAIKLVPADPKLAEAQLALWKTATALSHAHLIRLLDSGRCELGGQQFIFVVMEYAEETLAQILPHRALTPDEVRELLVPTLDALAFLHRQGFVQGQLKPPNFLVVNDQVKLASDNIRPAGQPTASTAKPSLYDPPEAKDGKSSAAGDIWGLGRVIVEALTQMPPAWPDQASDAVSLPATLPPTYADIVRRCLSRNPAGRPTISELEAQIKAAQHASAVSVAPSVVREAPAHAPTARKSPAARLQSPMARLQSPRARLFVAGIAGSLLILVAIWVGLRPSHGHPDAQQPASSTTTGQPPLQQAVTPAAVSQNPKAPMPAPGPVLHQEIPDVPHSARESIHGRIMVTVRVTVDRAGNVVDETLQWHGSSKYFARLATAAARKWKFAPADDQPSRVWVLRFEFTRGGTAGHALDSRRP